MGQQLIGLVLAVGLATTVQAATVFEQAQAAYGREDNVTAYVKCVETVEAAPTNAVANSARYLMNLLWANKLRPQERRQVLEQLQPTRPWLAGFRDALAAESETNLDRAVSVTLAFIGGAPDDGWCKLAAAQLCRQLPEVKTCTGDLTQLMQAATRLRQLGFRDCPDTLRSFAERLIAQYPKPDAARLRIEWRRLLLAGENRSGSLADRMIEQLVTDYLLAGATNEAKQCALELSGSPDNEWRTCLAVARAFVNAGDSLAGYELLRVRIEKMPVAERSQFAKYFGDQQEKMYRQYCETKDQAVATTLAGVWREGFLKKEIKDRIVQTHYHVVMRQRPGNYPIWEARANPSFPFPDVPTDYTTTLYVNDQRKNTFKSSGHAVFTTNNPIASMAGGSFTNGDVLECEVTLRQGKQWEASVRSNKIVLEGLKR